MAAHSHLDRTHSDRRKAAAVGARQPPLLVTGTLWGGLGALGLWFGLAPGAVSGPQALIALATLFIGAIVATFSLRFMRSDPRRSSYFATMLALVLSVLGFVLAGDLVVFALAWVASGLLLARLIGHAADWAEASGAAARARQTFLIGDSALLAELVLLSWQAGSTSIAAALAAVTAGPLSVLAALLILAGAVARCALPPFSGWLLTSMTAPTPVSALMHAGLVNAGGFVLLRFAPLFEAAPAARYAAVAIGLVASLWGLGIMAVRSDIKRSLAGSTVSQIGFMIMSCGLGAYTAALWHIVAHGLFKAWLFLGAGSAVGMRQGSAAAAPAPVTVGAIAAATLLGGSYLAFGHGMSGELVPLLLAVATAAAMLATSLAGRTSLRARLSLAATIAGLAVVHWLGFTFARALAGADGPALLTPAAVLVLLVAFLAAWLWQALRAARRAPLPPALYVRLLNAGGLAATNGGVK